jgi:hypothetical protein
MNAKNLMDIIRGAVARAKANGISDITIESLEALLAGVEPHLDTVSPAIEFAKLQQASDLAKYAADVEVGKSVIDTAKTLIRSLILINGGSAVALLAFIGHLASIPQGTLLIASFAVPLGWFVIGLLAAVLFAGSLCLGQKFFAESWDRAGRATVFVSAALALTSIIAFAIGSYRAYLEFAAIA